MQRHQRPITNGVSPPLFLCRKNNLRRIQIVNCRLARCLLSACGFPYNWKAPTCCSLSASDVEVTQARSLPPCCDAYTGTRTQHRKHAAHGLGLLFHSLRAFSLNVIKRNQASDGAPPLLPPASSRCVAARSARSCEADEHERGGVHRASRTTQDDTRMYARTWISVAVGW